MKEVLERTGLTDRAVRLYIANDLVAPECSRGYTGRNNYDFSEEDVEILQKIALLRKADFSLEQIKSLQAGGEEARTALASYLEEKREEYLRDGLILEALAGLPGEEVPNLDELCNRLTEGFREKKVPQSDLKVTWKERLESIFFLVVSGIGALFFLLVNWSIRLEMIERFPFRKWTSFPEVWIAWGAHLVVFLPVVLLIWVFLMYCKRRLVPKKRKRRLITACIAVALSVLYTLGPGNIALYMVQMAPVIYSETEDPDNYMVLGTDMQDAADYLLEIFPHHIPEEAYMEGSNWYSANRYLETTKYYYRYADFIDEDFDIFAQWVLTEDAFQEEIQRVKTNLADREIYERKWGDWICLSLTQADFEEVTSYYYHYFFAYNPKTHMVRYIYSHCQDGGGIYASPYFLTLDWDN
jgi:DNA-binding transcriptional MerR regulator